MGEVEGLLRKTRLEYEEVKAHKEALEREVQGVRREIEVEQ